MKKLLLSAATVMLAVGGLYAGCETPGTIPVVAGADVYDFKATVKTIGNKKTTLTISDDCLGTSVGSTVCYKILASRSFKGVFISCDCASLKANTAFFYIATSETKYQYVDSNVSGTDGTASYAFQILNIFGGPTASKSKNVQALMTLGFTDVVGGYIADINAPTVLTDITKTYALQAAGFGTQRLSKVSTLAGYVTGSVTAGACNCSAAFEVAFEPCTLAEVVIENNAVAGTWTLKYNSTLSKYATNNDIGEDGLVIAKKVFGTGASYPSVAE